MNFVIDIFCARWEVLTDSEFVIHSSSARLSITVWQTGETEKTKKPYIPITAKFSVVSVFLMENMGIELMFQKIMSRQYNKN